MFYACSSDFMEFVEFVEELVNQICKSTDLRFCEFKILEGMYNIFILNIREFFA